MAVKTARIEAHPWSVPPVPGAHLYDCEAGRVGVFQGKTPHDGRYWLRPVGGGVEWDARLADLYPADREEELRAKVEAANRRSRRGW
ncbi:hypothetical protein [Streptacidiphilus melanogenes]|uniref:hypothetical protein n=1 Tax=Streptacidiphilus melanogenes TaxID=411235 RepID=UPI00069508BB|nr:hypothetical protein [Streptacidiphilus melanogenes]